MVVCAWEKEKAKCFRKFRNFNIYDPYGQHTLEFHIDIWFLCAESSNLWRRKQQKSGNKSSWLVQNLSFERVEEQRELAVSFIFLVYFLVWRSHNRRYFTLLREMQFWDKVTKGKCSLNVIFWWVWTVLKLLKRVQAWKTSLGLKTLLRLETLYRLENLA